MIAALGRKSIGIYVISVPFVNSYILSRIPFINEIGIGGGIIETLLTIVITYTCTVILEKNKVTKKIFLGSR